MGRSLTGSHLVPKLAIDSNLACFAGKHSRCFLVSNLRDHTRVSLCLSYALKQGISSSEVGILSSKEIDLYLRFQRDGAHYCYLGGTLRLSPPFATFTASCASAGNAATDDPISDSDSGSDDEADSDSEARGASAQAKQKMELLKEGVSSLLPLSSQSLEPESWILTNGDVPSLVSNEPITKRYAPRRLLEFFTKKLDSQMFSLARLRSTLMFWKKKKSLKEDPSFGSSAFTEWKGVSQVHQWTATELTLQHARLTRIARDIRYLVLACSLLGFVRVLEALCATFSSHPPQYSKLLDAANCLDFFTMAYLAHSLRKPVVGILRVDPTNLDEVVELKAKIWDEMHKFFERQWKLVATLGVGRLLALIAQTLPSTNTMTRNAKMCWDFLLALPIF